MFKELLWDTGAIYLLLLVMTIAAIINMLRIIRQSSDEFMKN